MSTLSLILNALKTIFTNSVSTGAETTVASGAETVGEDIATGLVASEAVKGIESKLNKSTVPPAQTQVAAPNSIITKIKDEL